MPALSAELVLVHLEVNSDHKHLFKVVYWEFLEQSGVSLSLHEFFGDTDLLICIEKPVVILEFNFFGRSLEQVFETKENRSKSNSNNNAKRDVLFFFV